MAVSGEDVFFRNTQQNVPQRSAPIRRWLVSGRAEEKMQTTKLMLAVNGDAVEIVHPACDFSRPMSSFASVSHDGVTHHVVSVPDTQGFSYAMTTDAFTINGYTTHITEFVDDNSVGLASVVYRGILDTGNGALTAHSYDSPDHTVALLSAIDPQHNELGAFIGPNNRVDFATAPTVVLDVEQLGVLEMFPLTAEVNALLPEWSGTAVAGGELFAASMSRNLNYLILVTPTARVNILPNEGASLDTVATLAADLGVTWKS